MISDTSKLKIIVLIDKIEVPEWKHSLITNLSKSEKIKLVSICQTKENQKQEFQFRNFPQILFSKAFKLAYKFEKRKFSKLFKSKGTSNSKQNQHSKILIIENLNNFIEEKKPELILDLTSDLVSGSITYDTKYGIWYYKTSYLDKKLSYLFGFWELISKKGEIFGELIVTRGGSNISLSRTHSYTHRFSVYKSLLNHEWKISEHIFIEIKRFINNNYKYIQVNIPNETISLSELKQIQLVLKLPFFYIKVLYGGLLKKVLKKKWFILYYEIKDFKELFNLQINKFKKIPAPSNVDRADPFAIKNHESIYLFYEETEPNNSKGHISCSLFDAKENRMAAQKKILNTDFHLSFPNIFLYNNEYYMIPESQANKKIMLYKCEEFPAKWKWVKNLFENILATDSEIFFKDGYWWLFTCVRNERMIYNYDDLYLYYADDLLGKWHPHPLNPVVSDVKKARGAGKIFKTGNKLIRPSQNCKHIYGYGLNLNEITLLSTREYKEHLVKSYESKDSIFKNIHTLNVCDNHIFLDAKH